MAELIKADHWLFFLFVCVLYVGNTFEGALRYLTPSDPIADDGLRISQLI